MSGQPSDQVELGVQRQSVIGEPKIQRRIGLRLRENQADTQFRFVNQIPAPAGRRRSAETAGCTMGDGLTPRVLVGLVAPGVAV